MKRIITIKTIVPLVMTYYIFDFFNRICLQKKEKFNKIK